MAERSSEPLLVVDLAARSKNWALTPEGEERILEATPPGWRVHVVRALTSSDGDGPREPSAESLDAISGAEAYFGFGVPRPLFLAGKKLRWVHSAAAGVGNALYDEMRASDVKLTNSAGVHAVPIAEYVVAAVLHFFRGLDVAGIQQRERRWDKAFFVSEDSPVREVAGAHVLIVGTGGIGTEAATRLSALGATCVGIRRRPELGAPPGFERVAGRDALDRELGAADVVVLATPLTAESKGLFDRDRLARLASGAILVNVARGALVDEDALAECLRQGTIRGAGARRVPRGTTGGDEPALAASISAADTAHLARVPWPLLAARARSVHRELAPVRARRTAAESRGQAGGLLISTLTLTL